MKRNLGLILIALLAIGGCATKPSRDPAYAVTRPPQPTLQPDNPGGIYQAGYAISWFEDVKARRVGDSLTIRLVEATQASKKAATSTKKDTDIAMTVPTLLGGVPKLNYKGHDYSFETEMQANRQFSGEGSSSQGNSLTGNITVTVAEVLSNGNLVVRGEKLLTLNQGHEHIRIAGVVRPADILPDNSVLSTQVADAQITYAGEGVLDQANTKGWLARFFGSGWWPF
jgi:flagellar L-ring protein precursor FlgH